MTTRAINEAIGINGAYLPLMKLDNVRVIRARVKAGILQFRGGASNLEWFEPPATWQLASGSDGSIVARSGW